MRSIRFSAMWQIYFVITVFIHLLVCDSSSQQSSGSPQYNNKTPISSPEQCRRQCRNNEDPKTCYYKFVVEEYVVLGAACLNSTTREQCIRADGVERSVLSVNRMVPGPSIQVCEGDKVVIDVHNMIPGQEVTLHWHGILQRGTPYYDGVPMVSQCPIPQSTTFRYQWYANPGTHFWHSHSGLQKLDGLHGSVIVRQTRSRDIHSSLYDFDLPEHVIEISDWLHESAGERFPGRYVNRTNRMANQDPDNILINGLGKYKNLVSRVTTKIPYAVFSVAPGKRYRMRVIGSLATVCPVQISIENHTLLVIAADGEPVQPVVVNTVTLFSGERYDFVLTANQTVRSYWIQVRGLGECQEREVQQLAVLRYRGAPKNPNSTVPSYGVGLPQGVILNPLMSPCNGSNPDRICVSELTNAHPVDTGILQEDADVKIFIPYMFMLFSPAQLFRAGTYTTYLVNDMFLLNSVLSEITYASPPSPLISQLQDIPPGQICSYDSRPARCSNRSESCGCTHLLKLPLDAIIEIVLVDYVSVPLLSHPFHLHGYSYHVVDMGTFPNTNITMEEIQEVLNRDRRPLLQKQMNRPPGKDTLAVPNNGYTVVRFRADNPGYWFFHCHFLYHIVIGMNLVLQVGEQWEMPPVPPYFPKCGNYLPPITAPYSEWD